jgi:hypothetical protein
MNGTGLAKTQNVLNMKLSIRRIGLCWEATRAPRWTRIPQAWAALVAQAGLLRARQQSEKSTGLCGRASSNSKALKTKSKTSTNAGKKSVSLLSHAAFHAEPVHFLVSLICPWLFGLGYRLFLIRGCAMHRPRHRPRNRSLPFPSHVTPLTLLTYLTLSSRFPRHYKTVTLPSSLRHPVMIKCSQRIILLDQNQMPVLQ